MLDIFGVYWLSTKSREGLCGLLEVSTLDEVSWGIGEEDQTNTEDEAPCELDGDRDAVCSSVGSLLGSVDNDCCEKDTDGDAKLVSSNERTSNLLGAL